MIIINLEMVSKKLLDLTNLAKAQVFCIYILTKVIIVGKNKDFVFAAFQIVALSFKGFNNS